MIELDGAYGEGGGQLVRTAVALAAVTGTPIRIFNVRAGRAKPGLAPQHLAAVRAVGELCGAHAEGLTLKSERFTFVPGALRGGAFRFEVGTAGSVTLVLQAALPALLAAPAASRVTVVGGTDIRQAPPADYFSQVLLQLLARMGANVAAHILRRGYFPRGGGEIALDVAPGALRPLDLDTPGRLVEVAGLAHVAHLPGHIAERMRAAALHALGPAAVHARLATSVIEGEEAIGQGGAIVVWARRQSSVLGAGRVAERGVRAEVLGEAVGHTLAEDLASGAALDPHAADQILVYLALAAGKSSFTTREVSGHARTAMWLIERFLPVRFSHAQEGALVRVSVTPSADGSPSMQGGAGRMAALESGLAEKVASLRQAATYPDAVERVEAVETHMSWVFLADGWAYKLKKPVRRDFLDFSTPAARRRDCEAEVRLNRRLAPDVYLGVVPLTRDDTGRLALGGAGEAIDWLVKMRRLPAERMLDRALANGAAGPAAARQVAETLATFHRGLARVEMTPEAYRTRLAKDIDACRAELEQPAYAFPAEEVRSPVQVLAAFLRAQTPALDRRVMAGRIVEGHGDLRPEHVCLLEATVVIDCLAFNRDFRVLDGLDEIAYLAMECERLGHPAFGAEVLSAYREAAREDAPDALVHFYSAYRALVRAKIAVLHTHDASANEVPKWITRAREYLALAESHASGLR